MATKLDDVQEVTQATVGGQRDEIAALTSELAALKTALERYQRLS